MPVRVPIPNEGNPVSDGCLDINKKNGRRSPRDSCHHWVRGTGLRIRIRHILGLLRFRIAGLRIRIHFIRIRIEDFRLNTDPDQIRILGFNDQKLKKNYS